MFLSPGHTWSGRHKHRSVCHLAPETHSPAVHFTGAKAPTVTVLVESQARRRQFSGSMQTTASQCSPMPLEDIIPPLAPFVRYTFPNKSIQFTVGECERTRTRPPSEAVLIFPSWGLCARRHDGSSPPIAKRQRRRDFLRTSQDDRTNHPTRSPTRSRRSAL